MASLPSVVAAAVAGRVIRVAPLVRLDYASGTTRVWAGFGTLTAGGYDWTGLGDLGAIGAIESPMGGTAPMVTLTLSGVKPEMVATVLDSQAEVKGRGAAIYFQHFDENQQTLDDPLAVFVGTMDTIKISTATADTRVVELTLEWLFSRRSLSPFGYLSDTDQKALYPTDKGLEFVSAMQNKTVKWPAV